MLQHRKSSDLNEQVIARWLAYRDGPFVELVGLPSSNFYAYVFQGAALSIGPYDTAEEAIDDVQARVDNGQFDPPPANWVRLLAYGDPVRQFSDVEDE